MTTPKRGGVGLMTAADVPTDTDALRAMPDDPEVRESLAVIPPTPRRWPHWRPCPPRFSSAVRSSPTTSTGWWHNSATRPRNPPNWGNLREAVKALSTLAPLTSTWPSARTRFRVPGPADSAPGDHRRGGEPRRGGARGRSADQGPAGPPGGVFSLVKQLQGCGHPGDAEFPARVRPGLPGSRQREQLTPMHELSIAHAVVRTVVEALPIPVKVTTVRLRIGALSASCRRPFTSLTTSPPRALRSRVPCSRFRTCPSLSTARPAATRNRRESGTSAAPGAANPGDIVAGKELEVADVTFGRTRQHRAVAEGVLAKNDLLADGLRAGSPSTGQREQLGVEPGKRQDRPWKSCWRPRSNGGSGQRLWWGLRHRQRRQTAVPVRCEGPADHHRRHVPSGVGHDFRPSRRLGDGRLDLLVIENVGNLVCPTGYDLGRTPAWHWSVSPRARTNR